mmetsp:Transcript_90458/g.215946  ORF Transcript_90458/g.215946 Transcript_90458/m.215946 type:complete len:239 (-) Transcript_90458:130-846(-)
MPMLLPVPRLPFSAAVPGHCRTTWLTMLPCMPARTIDRLVPARPALLSPGSRLPALNGSVPWARTLVRRQAAATAMESLLQDLLEERANSRWLTRLPRVHLVPVPGSACLPLSPMRPKMPESHAGRQQPGYVGHNVACLPRPVAAESRPQHTRNRLSAASPCLRFDDPEMHHFLAENEMERLLSLQTSGGWARNPEMQDTVRVDDPLQRGGYRREFPVRAAVLAPGRKCRHKSSRSTA